MELRFIIFLCIKNRIAFIQNIGFYTHLQSEEKNVARKDRKRKQYDRDKIPLDARCKDRKIRAQYTQPGLLQFYLL